MDKCDNVMCKWLPTLALPLMLASASWAQTLQIPGINFPAPFDKTRSFYDDATLAPKIKKAHLLKKVELACIPFKKANRHSINELQPARYKNSFPFDMRRAMLLPPAEEMFKANTASSWLDDGINFKISDKALLSLDTNYSGTPDEYAKEAPILAEMSNDDKDLEVNFSLLVNVW